MRIPSSVERELASFMPVLVGIIMGILVIGAIVLVIVKSRENSGPLQAAFGRIIEKSPANTNESWIVVQCADGTRLRLRVNELRFFVCVGDEGKFEYRSQTLNGFQPRR